MPTRDPAGGRVLECWECRPLVWSGRWHLSFVFSTAIWMTIRSTFRTRLWREIAVSVSRWFLWLCTPLYFRKWPWYVCTHSLSATYLSKQQPEDLENIWKKASEGNWLNFKNSTLARAWTKFNALSEKKREPKFVFYTVQFCKNFEGKYSILDSEKYPLQERTHKVRMTVE